VSPDRDGRADGPEGREEALLLDRVRGGDRDAFEELVLRKRDRAFRLARRVVGHDEDARDVVQMAFLRVWRKIRRFRGGADFDPWFHRIVVNLAIDFVRRESARRRGRAAWAGEAGSGRGPASGSREVPGQMRAEEVSRIFDELAAVLPPRQRAIFALREIEGMSNDDVAALLRIRSSTVRNHLFQARRALQRALRARYPEYLPPRGRRREEP
jgi:RNA polymerase sigma-70 factor (ECF subfamily)